MKEDGQKTLIFIVTYNAQDHILPTLRRIPQSWLDSNSHDILIVDDASTDDTVVTISQYIDQYGGINITLKSNKENQGYGGNQKIGYRYALEHGYAHVVLLHGDGQYAPEYLGEMCTPLYDHSADVVLGSRMIYPLNALKGGMPLYKWIGNQILTHIQNLILRTDFAEFHTGYRAYNVSLLRRIPLEENSNYFDFDTEILIQMVDINARFKEISIPTFYGDEVSHVNGLKYAWLIIKTTIKSRLVKKKWAKDPRFIYPNPTY